MAREILPQCPLCMITSWKKNSWHLHLLCLVILFNSTAWGIFLCKTSPLYNGPFPSSQGPLFQNGSRYSAFDMEIIFHSHSFSYYIRTEQSWVTVYKEYCQSGGQKIPAGKKSSKEKTQQEIWVGSIAHALKSPSYEDYTAGSSLPTFVKHVFQQAR